SPDSSAAASSAGSIARKAPAPSVSTSAPRLTSISLAQSTISIIYTPAIPPALHLEILGEEGFVQLLNLHVVFLGVQEAPGQFLEGLFHIAGLAAGDPKVH